MYAKLLAGRKIWARRGMSDWSFVTTRQPAVVEVIDAGETTVSVRFKHGEGIVTRDALVKLPASTAAGMRCPKCGGSGQHARGKCYRCRGKGTLNARCLEIARARGFI